MTSMRSSRLASRSFASARALSTRSAMHDRPACRVPSWYVCQSRSTKVEQQAPRVTGGASHAKSSRCSPSTQRRANLAPCPTSLRESGTPLHLKLQTRPPPIHPRAIKPRAKNTRPRSQVRRGALRLRGATNQSANQPVNRPVSHRTSSSLHDAAPARGPSCPSSPILRVRCSSP